jgi:hypothetical protein
MRILAIFLVCTSPILSVGNQTLASKVVRTSLNQNEPAIIKLGTRGITTLEFPYKIEALDGYGFSLSPSPDGADLFQVSFNKGTNFLSLKAMREGVEGNLTVVLDGKVYCLFCTEVADPSFVIVFEDNTAKNVSNPREVLAKNKPVSPARLLGFLDKVKAYPSLKVTAAELFRNMEVAEPNSESSLDGLKVTLRRVIRDESLDSLGFDVELANQSDKDFFYDPESFGVRIGDEVYPAALSNGSGKVEAEKTRPAFFVVAGTATGGRNDLAVTNKFDVMLRQVVGTSESEAMAQAPKPGEVGTTVQGSLSEPPLPMAENGAQTPARTTVNVDRKARKAHRRRGKSSTSAAENYAGEQDRKQRNDNIEAEADE